MKITDLYNNEEMKDSILAKGEELLEDELFKTAEPMAQSLRIFNIFDIDKNSKIDINELKVICKSLNLHPNNVIYSNVA